MKTAWRWTRGADDGRPLVHDRSGRRGDIAYGGSCTGGRREDLQRYHAVLRWAVERCGACVNAGPGVSERPDQVTVSAINRNFPGRSGPGKVWLASPSTVAASAIARQIVSFEQLRSK